MSGPRLLRISRDAFIAHILTESHMGTRSERDDYFRTKVMPVARQARLLVHEFADMYVLPVSPLWGKTCLESDQALTPLGEKLIESLLTHHRFSQWADLQRALLQSNPTTGQEQFAAFLRGRGMMLNFWDLFYSVYGGLQDEIDEEHEASQHRKPRQIGLQPSPRREISRSVPNLRSESIESLEDLSNAVCALHPEEQALLIRDALLSVERIRHDLQGRPSEYFEAQVRIAFEIMRVQQGFVTGRLRESLQPLLLPNLTVKSDSPESVRLGLSGNPATDKMLLNFRNLDWAKKIEGHADKDRRGVMYVFGAAHLIDYDRFDGLLTLLRKRGFQIELIR